MADSIQKLIGFDAELWEIIGDYRFMARPSTESDAAGLSAQLGQMLGGYRPCSVNGLETVDCHT
jgi:hypothetical protein